MSTRGDVSTVAWHMSKEDAQHMGRNVQYTGKTTIFRRSANAPPRGHPKKTKEMHRVKRAIHDMQKDDNTSDQEFNVVRP